ncbi:hypothetical protein [Celeribacter halophilus]|uniref:hypothetical protein n=1 Tax=Celeribacter halophilus TaxID=576117 RepID=UPI001C08B8D3|nr:hypothetical protein [Celeribacter halophilus]MBU2889916.1 hypothetical protein [Celeribacter halophilus]MDO6509254.1 hypothetical protein [Celeribacter halophilus]
MHSTITHDISQARFDATAATERHLHYNGASLCDLLDALDDKSGFETFCDLHGILAQSFPDADAVEAALRHIHQVLARQKPSVLDRIGYERRLPASEMTRWHGARLSDILAMFPRAR